MDGEAPTLDIAGYQRSVRQYCRGVMNGTIKAGRLERLAVRRQLRDLRLAPARGYYFDSTAAAIAIAFFEAVLRHSTGEWAGEPFILSPHQRFVDWCVFGWKRKEDGTRRFRFVYQEEGRKNGKTARLAGNGLRLVKCDGETRAEVYCVATKEDQAKILFAEAVRMAKRIEEFAEIARIYESQKPRIVFTDDDSLFRPLGQDSKGQDGLNPSGVLLDELHAWRKQHVETYNTMTTGSGARRQPLIWTITTAGSERSELWASKRAAAVKAAEEPESGLVANDELFAFVCAVDDECDPLRADLDDGAFREWVESDGFADMMRQANPNLGVSCKIRDLRSNAILARNDPTERSKFLRYNCNRVASSVARAVRPDLWAKCGGPLHPERWGEMQPHGGFDLGRSDDFAAAAVVFPIPTGKVERDKETGTDRELIRYELKVRAWTCKDRPKELSAHPAIGLAIEQGILEVHDGDQIDFGEVEAGIVEMTREHDVGSWAFDPTFAQYVAQRLDLEHGITVYDLFQSYRNYNEPVRTLLRILRRPELLGHGDNPLLTWAAMNLSIKKNNKDEWMPEKGGPPDQKIDPMVAVLMGFAQCLFRQGEGKSVYDREGRGFVTL